MEHFNTDEGYPQTQAEVDEASTETLDAFMGLCDAEPAEPDKCLACYAYIVYCERENIS